jgi:ornithine decarboxylase antizyme 1
MTTKKKRKKLQINGVGPISVEVGVRCSNALRCSVTLGRGAFDAGPGVQSVDRPPPGAVNNAAQSTTKSQQPTATTLPQFNPNNPFHSLIASNDPKQGSNKGERQRNQLSSCSEFACSTDDENDSCSVTTCDDEDYWVTDYCMSSAANQMSTSHAASDYQEGNMAKFVKQLFGVERVVAKVGKDEERDVLAPVRNIGNVRHDGLEKDVRCMQFVSAISNGMHKQRHVTWNIIHWTPNEGNNSVLFVQVDSAAFPEGSRRAFVQLLDYAEAELECGHVFVVFPAQHEHRATIVKTFMFLGFVPVKPGHAMLPEAARECGDCGSMFMCYEIE